MSELHTTYAPLASATNVINYSGQVGSTPTGGQNSASGNVPTATLNDPDNIKGSNAPVTANEGQNITVTGTVVHGRYDSSTVINNPA